MKTKSNHKPSDEYDPLSSFRMPVKHHEVIMREALRRHLKKSDILREIVREWVEKKTGRA